MITIYVYVLDTLADWELGHVTSELNSGRFFKVAVSATSALLLPGANTWNDAKHRPILEKAKEFLSAGAMVGAICATAGGYGLP